MLLRYCPSFLICLFVVGLVGCGLKRDLSTPSKRFLGQWNSNASMLSGSNHYFVSPVDEKTGVGNYTSWSLLTNAWKKTPYKIVSEDEGGTKLVVGLDTDNPPDGKYDYPMYMFIDKDGESLKATLSDTDNPDDPAVRKFTHDYVDDKTEPESK